MQRAWKNLTKSKEISILAIIVVLAVCITIVNPNFLTVSNFFDIMRSNSVYGIMALGMLPVLVSGGIDLSVSSTITLCAVVMGKFLQANPGSNMVVTVLLCMAVGALAGLVNGLLVTKFHIPPIVATLGTQTIVMAAVLFYTNGIWISGMPDWFLSFGDIQFGAIPSGGKTVGMPVQILFLALVGAATWLILKYTLTGRGIYAIGGNVQSATRVGYNVPGITAFVYIYSGVLAGLAAVTDILIVKQIDPNTFSGCELDVIAIAVLGGASVMGGTGTVFGTFLGIILMAVIKNGLVLVRVSSYWQKVVMGIIILVTISVDVINRRIEKSRLVHVDVEE